MAETGYDPQFGARPLRRVIQDSVEDKLSDAILGGDLHPVDTALVDHDGEDLIVKSQKAITVAQTT